MPSVNFNLNGESAAAAYEPGMNLLDVLREECGVTSCKNGCAPEGACGCCAVLDNGRPVLSCLRNPEQMEGHQITTMEGVEEDLVPRLADVMQEGAVHCGFCIPVICDVASLLVRKARRDDCARGTRQAGHIAVALGQARILDAIQTAGEARRTAA